MTTNPLNGVAPQVVIAANHAVASPTERAHVTYELHPQDGGSVNGYDLWVQAVTKDQQGGDDWQMPDSGSTLIRPATPSVSSLRHPDITYRHSGRDRIVYGVETSLYYTGEDEDGNPTPGEPFKGLGVVTLTDEVLAPGWLKRAQEYIRDITMTPPDGQGRVRFDSPFSFYDDLYPEVVTHPDGVDGFALWSVSIGTVEADEETLANGQVLDTDRGPDAVIMQRLYP